MKKRSNIIYLIPDIGRVKHVINTSDVETLIPAKDGYEVIALLPETINKYFSEKFRKEKADA